MNTIAALKLTAEGAMTVLQEAQQKAKQMGVSVSVAVVDEGGHLLAFARADKTRLYTIPIALAKARSAALMQNPTGRKRANGSEMSEHHAVVLTLAGGPDTVATFPGGVPIQVDGQVVGGVGVSGTKDVDDCAIAEAGVAALAK